MATSVKLLKSTRLLPIRVRLLTEDPDKLTELDETEVRDGDSVALR